MRVSNRSTIFLLIFVILLSIFLSSVNNMIKYDSGPRYDYANIKSVLKESKAIGSDFEEIVWFIQISDLHISIFRDLSRITEFKEFCLRTVEIIRPIVVLASGDLTDAKEKNNMGSTQFKEEWEHYYNTLINTNVTEITTWLDLRGNHDNFNVLGINSPSYYYGRYSIQGPKYSHSYLHISEKDKVKIAFLGVDACPEPGLRRPFNFIGVLNPQQQRHIKMLYDEANSKASYVIWFSHYPSSCILWLADSRNNTDNLRDLIGSSPKSLVHLDGHLHNMGGAVRQMYALQHPGYLELELGDWKDNRIFRLAAIDHGIFSFVDEQHGNWPLILITNPKHAAFVMPSREPLHLIQTSTHIRILAFSISEIQLVEVRLLSHNNSKWMPCSSSKPPLYTCIWDPSKFQFGVHYIEVRAVDMQSRKRSITQPFSLDGSRIHFGVIPRMILMIDATVIFQYVFSTFLLITTLPLCWLRVIGRKPTGTWRRFRALWMLSKIRCLYYPLILYPIYLAFFPWSIGELIEGHLGVIFVWGIFVNQSFIPGSFTYLYGSAQLAIVHIPLVLVLAKCVKRRVKIHWISIQHSEREEPSQMFIQKSKIKQILAHIPFILLLSTQMLLAYFFWLAYGTIAFLIGPMRTWPILLSIILWYKALTLPVTSTREVLKICYPSVSS